MEEEEKVVIHEYASHSNLNAYSSNKNNSNYQDIYTNSKQNLTNYEVFDKFDNMDKNKPINTNTKTSLTNKSPDHYVKDFSSKSNNKETNRYYQNKPSPTRSKSRGAKTPNLRERKKH